VSSLFKQHGNFDPSPIRRGRRSKGGRGGRPPPPRFPILHVGLDFRKWNGSHSYMIRKDVIYFSRYSRDSAESDARGKLKFATWENALP
jgi:hypothetical protein